MNFYHVTQVHGVEIVSIETLPAEADGMVASLAELNEPMAIKTADCLPIVIEGEKGVVFLHAGWRGLADGILRRPEIAVIAPQRVFIGPSIHVCCFEVTPDFKDNFKNSTFFRVLDGKLHFDLQQEARHLLREEFPNLLVSIAPICTCCHKDFHSYRRDKTKNRNWNIYIKG
ncbi:MAG: polyphenol oxidase family protein [Bdellovibrionales bacterium]|nr:polyphenol oxidase family protein [Bdellovibrionales bacterium]